MMALPDTYKQVEYIRTSGTQYINTNITTTGTDNTIIEGDIKFYNTVSSSQANGKNTKNWLFMGVSGNNKFYGGSGSTWGETTVTNDKEKHNIRISTAEQKLYIDNVGYTFSGEASQYTASGYICIGCVHTPEYSQYSYFCQEDIYSFKVTQGGTLVRDFIPVLRISDNKPGLYDLVNNVFYTNQGTGEFTYEESAKSGKIKKMTLGTDLIRPSTPSVEDIIFVADFTSMTNTQLQALQDFVPSGSSRPQGVTIRNSRMEVANKSNDKGGQFTHILSTDFDITGYKNIYFKSIGSLDYNNWQSYGCGFNNGESSSTGFSSGGMEHSGYNSHSTRFNINGTGTIIYSDSNGYSGEKTIELSLNLETGAYTAKDTKHFPNGISGTFSGIESWKQAFGTKLQVYVSLFTGIYTSGLYSKYLELRVTA